MKKTPLVRKYFSRRVTPAKKTNMKAKQLSVTKEEKEYWNRLATEIGCIACSIDGNSNYYVSIHHCDGRTKPNCHNFVLPLCSEHHQHNDTDPVGRVGIHPYKSRFEKKYGTEKELKQRCDILLRIFSMGKKVD